jgi:hypothetical protein
MCGQPATGSAKDRRTDPLIASKAASPRLFGAEPPRPGTGAIRIVDMSRDRRQWRRSIHWSEFGEFFRQTRTAFRQHENAKAELKGRDGAISFDLLEVEAGYQPNPNSPIRTSRWSHHPR